MAKIDKAKIKQSPVDYLYVFTNDSFISLVAKYISPQAAQTIKLKAYNQKKLLVDAYEGNNKLTEAYEDLRGWIYDAYGYTPQEILKKLLAGEACAGKNWAAGIYGVGATLSSGWTKNGDYYVDKESGALKSRSGALIPDPVITYDNKGNAIGYTYTINGSSFYSTYNKKGGGWFAGAMSDKDGMYNPDGSVFTGANSSSIWESINSSMSYFSSFLEWLFDLFGFNKSERIKITPQNTMPAQGEISTKTTQKTGSENILLLGGISLMAYLFLKKK